MLQPLSHSVTRARWKSKRLLFTADDSGAGTAISISSDDGDGDDTDSSGLSQLAYNIDSGSFVGNLTEAQSSKDASFTLNGLSSLTHQFNRGSGRRLRFYP